MALCCVALGFAASACSSPGPTADSSEPVAATAQAMDGGDAGAPTGTACGNGAECQSGHCVEDVCCESACTAECFACNAAATGQPDGACAPVAKGTVDDGCTQELPSTCGQTGTCDGAGACELHPAGTQCGTNAPQCAGTIALESHACDGAGACLATPMQDCAPQTCNQGRCETTCVSPTDCVGDTYCDTEAGECRPRLSDGKPCAGNQQCDSGNCADGVCCDRACTGVCEACVKASTGLATGRCGSVKKGTDPDDECEEEDECGLTGSCDGQGSCQLREKDSPCGDGANCDADTRVAFSCDGFGACRSAEGSCAPFACAAGECRTSCDTDKDCAADRICNAPTGKCLVSLGRCTDDVTFLSNSGEVKRCEPFKCGELGCLTTCSTNSQCAGGARCDADGQCVTTGGGAPKSTPGDDGGCSVGAPGRPVTDYWSVLLAAAVMGAARKRR